MDKKPIGYKAGKGTIIDKKVPTTHKYDNVKSKYSGKIGTSIKDVQYISNNGIAKKRGQLFRRIRPSTLWNMLNQQQKSQSIYNIDDKLSKTSKLTSITINTYQLPVGLQTPFLLIDMREAQQFEQFHIKEAVCFPATRIKQDKMIPQLSQYKNKQNKIIIVYHFDERKGIEYTNQFCQKGFDNIYFLNGGIEGFGQQIGDGLQGKCIPIFSKKQEVKKLRMKR